jgi:hypothetical protein
MKQRVQESNLICAIAQGNVVKGILIPTAEATVDGWAEVVHCYPRILGSHATRTPLTSQHLIDLITR